MKEISIIGATSSLGVNLVSLLVASGYQVFAGFRSENRVPQEWQQNPAIVLQKLDLTQEPNFNELCRQTVVWLAHLEQGRFNERETQVNLAPFENLLARAAASATEKFVFVSSGGSVYGAPQFLPITENHPREPLSSYGKAKRAMEDALTEISKKSSLKTAVLRPGNIYGFEDPRRASKGIVAAFLDAAANEKPFTLIHRGQTVRDFVHVDDVSRAILTALESEKKEIVWNVATGSGTTAARVLEMVLEKSGLPAPEIKHIENFASDVDANVLSIEKITAESDWTPRITLTEGIARSVEKWQPKNISKSFESRL